jgi:hypothetical protein
MSAFPETVPFALAFRAVFAVIAEAGYSILDNPEVGEDDPEDLREAFDGALGESASALGELFSFADSAETMGELADIILADGCGWSALNEFLIETTDR